MPKHIGHGKAFLDTDRYFSLVIKILAAIGIVIARLQTQKTEFPKQMLGFATYAILEFSLWEKRHFEICKCIYIYIYIYIEREKYIYIYIYIYIFKFVYMYILCM